ncbi:MAG: ATP-dependent helicase [Desulfuromonadales bacterium]|nr:ATP-dependent helicase [Desulfuromonadales bacterium]
MIAEVFKPTKEQDKVIRHSGSAFITACPGAGKTRVMVERAREILSSRYDARGIAFLSFTRAAVSELENRLRREALLSSPAFPHFIGTFDSFIWQFFIAPFGIPDTEAVPHLIPDMGSRIVQPFDKAQPLTFSCFDRSTGKIDAAAAIRSGFNISNKGPAIIKAYETSAKKMLARFRERGELDFEDARVLAVTRLANEDFAVRFSLVLAARFSEVIVDEAQDCNPADLEIIRWLRDAGIPTKVVCDPHQSIYEFRGGITDQLVSFAYSFDKNDQLGMSGNFRSSDNICKAIVMLRAVESRKIVDEPLGKYKHELANIYVLSYAGNSVPATIGGKFVELLNELKIDVASAPVLAKTRNSGSNAIGQPVIKTTRDLTFRLAEAVSDFYFAIDLGNQKSAIEEVHKIILELEGRLSGKSYHQCVVAHDIKSDDWRPQVLHVLRALRYDPKVFADADVWHSRAKELLEPFLPANSPSISQKLKKNRDIAGVLVVAPVECPPAKTIHSVKGMEYPAVCVVTVAQNVKGILDYLETGAPVEKAETARELYVAASRAQRLLVIATPKSQSARFAAHLRTTGAAVTVLDI